MTNDPGNNDRMNGASQIRRLVRLVLDSLLSPFGLELRRRQAQRSPWPNAPLPEVVARVQQEIAKLCPHSNYAGNYRRFEYAFWAASLPMFWCLSKDGGRRRVLDVGCGYGTLLGVLHELGWEVHGTDMLPVTELMGEETQRRFQIDFRPSNIEAADLPYEDGTFDVVVMSEIIEHFHFQPLTALRRAFRQVRPGGFLFVTTPALGYGWRQEQYTQPFEEIAEYRAGGPVIDPHKHMKIYSPSEFRRLLGACGGRDVLCDVSTSPHKTEAHCVGFVWK